MWHWRTYSVTSRPDDRLLAVTVTAIPGGTCLERLAHATSVGTVLRLGPPAGEFVLPEPVSEKLLFVTAGSGVTPVMGMLRHLAATRPEVLAGAVAVHCDRTEADVVFGAELRALAARPGCAWSSGTPPATAGSPRTPLPISCPTGRDVRPGRAVRPACSTTSLTGGTATATRTRCTSSGSWRRSRRPAAGTGGRVRFTESKIEADAAPGEPLMRAGEAAGAMLPNGCRMGICHTCVGRLRSGAVTNLHTGERHDTPGEPVRTCVSGAAGDVEIEL